MGTRYQHLTIEERCELARLRAAGHSVRQIAAGLDRSPSTVARELRRNGSKTQGYRPSYAQQQASARRWRGSPVWTGTSCCRNRSSPVSAKAGPPSRCQDDLPWNPAAPSFPTRPSTASSTPSWPVPRTITGVTTCLGPSPSGAGGAAKAAALTSRLPKNCRSTRSLSSSSAPIPSTRDRPR